MIFSADAQWVGRPITDTTANSQRLNELHDLWKSERANKSLPARTSFHFRRMRPWLGHVALVEVSHNPIDFRYRLFGTQLAQWSGADFGGKSFVEAYGAQGVERILGPFDECVRNQSPVFTRQHCQLAVGPMVFLEQLLLPCSGADHRVELIVGAAYLRAQN